MLGVGDPGGSIAVRASRTVKTKPFLTSIRSVRPCLHSHHQVIPAALNNTFSKGDPE